MMEEKRSSKSVKIIDEIHGHLTSIEDKLSLVSLLRLEEACSKTESPYEGDLVERLKALLKRIVSLEDSISI